MKSILKFTSIIVLLTLVLSLASACEKKEPIAPETTEEPEATIDPNATVLDLVVNGETTFKLAKADSKSENYVYDAVSYAKKILKNNLSIDPDISFEDTGDYEIIIGNVGRPEFETLSEKKFLARDFFVGVMDKKFVIYSTSDEGMDAALEYFNALISAKAAKDSKNVKLISTENKEFILNNITIGSSHIYDYTIVYSMENLYSPELVAKKLKKVLEDATGESINLITDRSSEIREDKKFIVIGNTLFGEMPKCEDVTCKIETKDGNIYMYSSSIEGYNTLIETLFLTLSETNDKAFETLSAEGKAPQSTYTKLKEEIPGDIRVIFNNILGNCDTSKYPVPFRTRSVVEMLQSYSPDVLGLQECSPNSRASGTDIVDYLDFYGYSEVKVTVTNSKKSNYTPLFYNPKTVKVIESGYDYYPGSFNDGGSKSITWAVFEVLKSGERFGVCSTHFFYQSDAGDGRVENATMLADRCIEIYKKYNCPVLAGGDLNCSSGSAPLKKLISKGLKHIREVAKATNAYKTHHAYPEYSTTLKYYDTFTMPTKEYAKSIDHVFSYMADDVTFHNYQVITEDYALMSSDHCPILIDLSFKK